MTTYEGKGFSYVSGKEAPNKEPPITHHLAEKSYNVHRRRLLKTERVVDDRMVIPEFMTNQLWKKLCEQHKARFETVI